MHGNVNVVGLFISAGILEIPSEQQLPFGTN